MSRRIRVRIDKGVDFVPPVGMEVVGGTQFRDVTELVLVERDDAAASEIDRSGSFDDGGGQKDSLQQRRGSWRNSEPRLPHDSSVARTTGRGT